MIDNLFASDQDGDSTSGGDEFDGVDSGDDARNDTMCDDGVIADGTADSSGNETLAGPIPKVGDRVLCLAGRKGDFTPESAAIKIQSRYRGRAGRLEVTRRRWARQAEVAAWQGAKAPRSAVDVQSIQRLIYGLEELASLCFYCGRPCHASGWGAARTANGYCCAKFEKAPRNKATVSMTELLGLAVDGDDVDARSADAKVAALDMVHMAQRRSNGSGGGGAGRSRARMH